MKDWYPPRAVSGYSKAQVKWLISNLSTLRDGSYPRNPKESGYTDPAIRQKQVNSTPKFELPAIIAAELDVRIQKAGVDGLMCEFLYAFEPADEVFVVEHIAQCLNVERREVEQRIRNALYFVSGEKRKAGSYRQYVRNHWSYLRLK